MRHKAFSLSAIAKRATHTDGCRTMQCHRVYGRRSAPSLPFTQHVSVILGTALSFRKRQHMVLCRTSHRRCASQLSVQSETPAWRGMANMASRLTCCLPHFMPKHDQSTSLRRMRPASHIYKPGGGPRSDGTRGNCSLEPSKARGINLSEGRGRLLMSICPTQPKDDGQEHSSKACESEATSTARSDLPETEIQRTRREASSSASSCTPCRSRERSEAIRGKGRAAPHA